MHMMVNGHTVAIVENGGHGIVGSVDGVDVGAADHDDALFVMACIVAWIMNMDGTCTDRACVMHA